MITIGTSPMSYNKSRNTLFASASDHQIKLAPQRLKVASHKTGNMKLFEMCDHIQNDGEIQAWVYVNKQTMIRLVIFND